MARRRQGWLLWRRLVCAGSGGWSAGGACLCDARSILICAGWLPQDGVRLGRFGGSEVERHEVGPGAGSISLLTVLPLVGPLALLPGRCCPQARSVILRVASAPVRLGVARSRGQGWAAGPPRRGVALTPAAGDATDGRGGGESPRGAVGQPSVSGRMANDQHQPASSRAMATQATVCFLWCSVRLVQRACSRWLPACPRARAAAGA